MAKVAVLLSGCGFLDGAEIRESVITLLALDREGANVSIFAPDIPQAEVVNHLTGETTQEQRNVLVESARIARGNIRDITHLHADDFDALIVPGGFGVAKQFCNLATAGTDMTIAPEIAHIIKDFHSAKKPIGAICISPALVAGALSSSHPAVTLGDDNDGLIAGLGGKHVPTQVDDITVDEQNKIISCAAYMQNAALKDIATGIEKLVKKVVALSNA